MKFILPSILFFALLTVTNATISISTSTSDLSKDSSQEIVDSGTSSPKYTTPTFTLPEVEEDPEIAPNFDTIYANSVGLIIGEDASKNGFSGKTLVNDDAGSGEVSWVLEKGSTENTNKGDLKITNNSDRLLNLKRLIINGSYTDSDSPTMRVIYLNPDADPEDDSIITSSLLKGKVPANATEVTNQKTFFDNTKKVIVTSAGTTNYVVGDVIAKGSFDSTVSNIQKVTITAAGETDFVVGDVYGEGAVISANESVSQVATYDLKNDYFQEILNAGDTDLIVGTIYSPDDIEAANQALTEGQTLATSAGSLGVAPTAEDREFVLIETGGDTTMVPGNYVAKTIFDSRNSALNDPDVEILVAGASDFELYSTNNTTYKKSVVDAYNYTINGSDFDYTTYDADAAYYNEQPSTGPSPTLATRATTIYDYIPMDANFTHTLIIPELLGGKVWLEAGESASFRIEIDSYDSDASVEISAVEFTGDLYKRFGPPPQYSDDSHADLAGVGIIGIHDFTPTAISQTYDSNAVEPATDIRVKLTSQNSSGDELALIIGDFIISESDVQVTATASQTLEGVTQFNHTDTLTNEIGAELVSITRGAGTLDIKNNNKTRIVSSTTGINNSIVLNNELSLEDNGVSTTLQASDILNFKTYNKEYAANQPRDGNGYSTDAAILNDDTYGPDYLVENFSSDGQTGSPSQETMIKFGNSNIQFEADVRLINNSDKDFKLKEILFDVYNLNSRNHRNRLTVTSIAGDPTGDPNFDGDTSDAILSKLVKGADPVNGARLNQDRTLYEKIYSKGDTLIPGKRGVSSGSGNKAQWQALIDTFQPTWHYSWSAAVQDGFLEDTNGNGILDEGEDLDGDGVLDTTGYHPAGVEFVPQIWGSGSLDTMKQQIRDLTPYINAGIIKNIIGFNEPGLITQSGGPIRDNFPKTWSQTYNEWASGGAISGDTDYNSIEEMVTIWRALVETLEEEGTLNKVNLISPVPSNRNNIKWWLIPFLTRLDQEGLKWDAVGLHRYAYNNDPEAFISALVEDYESTYHEGIVKVYKPGPSPDGTDEVTKEGTLWHSEEVPLVLNGVAYDASDWQNKSLKSFGKKIWLKEFSLKGPNGSNLGQYTTTQVNHFLDTVIAYLEGWENLERYAWFTADPGGAYIGNGQWDSVIWNPSTSDIFDRSSPGYGQSSQNDVTTGGNPGDRYAAYATEYPANRFSDNDADGEYDAAESGKFEVSIDLGDELDSDKGDGNTTNAWIAPGESAILRFSWDVSPIETYVSDTNSDGIDRDDLNTQLLSNTFLDNIAFYGYFYNINNSDSDAYPDYADKFPTRDDEWFDTDKDGYGNNEDVFDDDATEWFDTDNDLVGDNKDGYPADAKRSTPRKLGLNNVIDFKLIGGYIALGKTPVFLERYGIGDGTFTIVDIPSSHPIAIICSNNGLSYSGTVAGPDYTHTDGNVYPSYSGSITLTINGDFQIAYLRCANHGAMSGLDNNRMVGIAYRSDFTFAPISGDISIFYDVFPSAYTGEIEPGYLVDLPDDDASLASGFVYYTTDLNAGESSYKMVTTDTDLNEGTDYDVREKDIFIKNTSSFGDSAFFKLKYPDTDDDGYADSEDFAVNDSTEYIDSDSDDVGDNADAFPNNPSETADSDDDGVGDNADKFPDNPTETADSDNDGVGDNADTHPYDKFDGNSIQETAGIGWTEFLNTRIPYSQDTIDNGKAGYVGWNTQVQDNDPDYKNNAASLVAKIGKDSIPDETTGDEIEVDSDGNAIVVDGYTLGSDPTDTIGDGSGGSGTYPWNNVHYNDTNGDGANNSDDAGSGGTIADTSLNDTTLGSEITHGSTLPLASGYDTKPERNGTWWDGSGTTSADYHATRELAVAQAASETDVTWINWGRSIKLVRFGDHHINVSIQNNDPEPWVMTKIHFDMNLKPETINGVYQTNEDGSYKMGVTNFKISDCGSDLYSTLDDIALYQSTDYAPGHYELDLPISQSIASGETLVLEIEFDQDQTKTSDQLSQNAATYLDNIGFMGHYVRPAPTYNFTGDPSNFDLIGFSFFVNIRTETEDTPDVDETSGDLTVAITGGHAHMAANTANLNSNAAFVNDTTFGDLNTHVAPLGGSAKSVNVTVGNGDTIELNVTNNSTKAYKLAKVAFDYNRPTNNKRPDTLTVTAGGTQIYNTVLPTWSSSATESDISFDVAEDIIIAAGESTIINLTASNATGANAAAQFDNIALVGEFEE